ncbi:MAG TPA: hopanoid-associated sugar epimerase [Hypericibacter adhaerens]|jgi:dihydroflavonol-4-reductase|uniref:NAD-dependent dehydratase n=1 Tax=Hypericibacter adhaerens TaxID=2602016 RepID=A0A5J6MZ72_9PROT|nr:hopanoid-associated sugar epimerase [Hypericibacter adhaerens]QEX21580.1 NAD-dependent dehydratase [Hypericibacter adhaerens]HWA46521.1 hopanoid-associated sugar epimerase [Hypericibacter adhaerens]
MTTLITGATGFVGSALARKLIARGERVRVLVRPTADRRNLEELDVEIAAGDLTDPASLAAAVKGCEALFHVAADYRLWVPDRARMFESNVEGTRRLMQAAGEAGVTRIVYTSSVATLLPRPGGTPAGEEDAGGAGDMIGAYKQSKHAAEIVVREMIERQGLPAVITHPSTPIGPRDIKPTPTGKMVVDAASGRMPAYVDTGLNVVHVDDVAEGHILAFERGRIGRNYILGSENMSLAEILGLVAAMTHRRPPRIKLPHGLVIPIAGLAEIGARLTGREPFTTREAVKLARKTMFFTSDRAIEELGYRPRPAREAIADAIAWFREHGYVG